MTRRYNFNPGPAMLPEPVLERIRTDLPEYRQAGASVMEISHRGDDFDAIAEAAEQRVRRLLKVSGDYAVLFLAGGASFQFAQLPMNLAASGIPGAYLVHGHWGRKAYAEAARMDRGWLLATSEEQGFDRIPGREEWRIPGQAAYLHFVSNETLFGVQFQRWPQADWPLAADMTSDLFSRPLDVARFGVIYAGAQKNAGIAGLSLVMVHRALLERVPQSVPGALSWREQERHQCRFNTPPVFNWYVAELVLKWIEEQGGLAVMQERSRRKAGMLYDCIDSSGLYRNAVPGDLRSLMNVTFRLRDESLDSRFLACALEAGLMGLRGHAAVGGMRASIYNAMPERGVAVLRDFMREFERRYG